MHSGRPDPPQAAMPPELLALVTAGGAASGCHRYRVCAALVADIKSSVRSETEQRRRPGSTLGVRDRDETLAATTYGLTDIASREPVSPATLFEIGSIGSTPMGPRPHTCRPAGG
jgi:CubicO group peptidase (beta-lactamase class C family)